MSTVVVVAHLLAVLGWSDLSWWARGTGVVAVLVLTLLSRGVGGASVRADARSLAVGVVGVVTGLGVGAIQLALAGASLLGVLGTVAMLAGLVLTVSGGVGLVRRLPRWWRLASVPVVVLLLQFVLIPVPVALYATHVPDTAPAAATPDGAEEVRLRTGDGVQLAAWYWPSTTGAAVVLRHGSGAGSSKASVVDHARVLAAHGFGVLATDARGHGESEGWAMDFGWHGDEDVDAALTWLAARPEVDADRIGAVGLSMGGEELLGAAGTDTRIGAVVAEGVSGRQAADHATYGYRGLQAQVDRTMGWISDRVVDAFTRADRPRVLTDAVAATAPRPVLLISGQDAIERRAARGLAARAPDAVTTWELSDTPHIAGLAEHPEAWEERVVGFLDEALS